MPASYQLFYTLNPLAQLIYAYRDILLHGRWPNLLALLAVAVVSTVVLWIGHRLFTRASRSFAEEV